MHYWNLPEERTVVARNIYLAIPRWLGRGIRNLQVPCSNHSFVLWLTQSFVLPRSIKWLRSTPGDYVIPYYGFAGLRQKTGTIKKDCKVFFVFVICQFFDIERKILRKERQSALFYLLPSVSFGQAEHIRCCIYNFQITQL